MQGEGDSAAAQPLIDAAAKDTFLAALRGGMRREDAAAAAGFSLTGFYGARARDPAFAAAWADALAAVPPAERQPPRAWAEGEVRIAPANRRLYQKRRRRNVRFDERRRLLFLKHFAATCDAVAAAEAAGVSKATVQYHVRTDPAFAAVFEEILDAAYLGLEAELLRQRIEAQQRLRDALADPDSQPLPPDAAVEFERGMKLLARWDRKRPRPDGRGQRRDAWTFDSAMDLLEDRLKVLGVEVVPLAPEEAAAWDGESRCEGEGGDDPPAAA